MKSVLIMSKFSNLLALWDSNAQNTDPVSRDLTPLAGSHTPNNGAYTPGILDLKKRKLK